MLKRNYQAVLSVLDQLHVGLCIVLENGSVVVCNAEAERIFAGFSGIRLTPDNRLHCTNKETQRLLERALHKACRQDECRENFHRNSREGLLNRSFPKSIIKTPGKPPEIILVPEPDQGVLSPLIEVMPLCEADDNTQTHLRGAVVTIIDTSNPRELCVDRVATAFGLTSAETEICRMLVEGLTTREMADERRVSIETVKTQIKSVLRKSHCKRRSELIRSVTVMYSPIGGN